MRTVEGVSKDVMIQFYRELNNMLENKTVPDEMEVIAQKIWDIFEEHKSLIGLFSAKGSFYMEGFIHGVYFASLIEKRADVAELEKIMGEKL